MPLAGWSRFSLFNNAKPICMGIKDASSLEFTCSTIFLLPAIGLQRKDILKYGFMNAYLNDINHEPQHDLSLYLLFKPGDMDAFQVFLDKEYKRTKSLIEDYDYAGGYVVTVYRMSQEYLKEYEMFLKGKYSKFRKKYMQLFAKTVEVMDENGKIITETSLAHHIFDRTPSMREYWEEKLGENLDEDAEMWSKPDFRGGETLDIYKIGKR
jgi:hypothetical protein